MMSTYQPCPICGGDLTFVQKQPEEMVRTDSGVDVPLDSDIVRCEADNEYFRVYINGQIVPVEKSERRETTQTVTKCPTCGKPPVKIEDAREPVTTAIGDAMPEPRMTKRGICENGHRWFARDEKRDGP